MAVVLTCRSLRMAAGRVESATMRTDRTAYRHQQRDACAEQKGVHVSLGAADSMTVITAVLAVVMATIAVSAAAMCPGTDDKHCGHDYEEALHLVASFVPVAPVYGL